MQSTLHGPAETIVSSAHGNAGFSDAANPVTISHHSQGAVITPPPTGATSTDSVKPAPVIVGKVHYALPTLRIPDEKNSRGSLVDGIVSTALDISVAPYSSKGHQDENKNYEQKGGDSKPGIMSSPTTQGTSKITTIDIYTGRELLWSSNKVPDGQQIELPTNQDKRLHVVSVIWPDDKRQFNENVRGLGVTLTVEFSGESSALMISSIAVVQDWERLRRG